jgi:glycosyltransferase involved in cell wall biosynthesis
VPDLDAALVIPDGTPHAGGNWVSARRWQRALEAAGITAEIFWLSEARPPARLVHALNARTTALPLLESGVPPTQLVVTWTGTDLWSEDTFQAGAVARLGAVPWHTVFTKDAVGLLERRFAGHPARFVQVPPAVDLAAFHPEGRKAAAPHPLAILVGGIRPVKGTHRAIELVRQVRAQGYPLALAIAGPARDPAYWRQVETMAAGETWVHWLGDLSWDNMPRWYRAADLVLNTSDSEGLSNALLEALASARPVVARDIPGNRAVVHPGLTGWLFQDAEEFLLCVTEVLENPAGAARRGLAARAWIQAHCSPGAEARGLLAVYRAAGVIPHRATD